VRTAEDLAERDALLPLILRGEASPADAAQQARFGDFCVRYKRLDAAASRFYAAAFAADPTLAGDPRSGVLYDAACAAALAGCGQGDDAATTDARERGRWRRQALDWLRADLSLWSGGVGRGTPEDRGAALGALKRCKGDHDLAGVRDADALEKLAAEERDAWRAFWADVDALLKELQEK
jgi:serine/threonine-protein kinase